MKKIPCRLLLLVALCASMSFTGCVLYEHVDTEITPGPEAEPAIDPQPWDPQPGEDDIETGH